MKYYPNDIVEVINGEFLPIGHRYHVLAVDALNDFPKFIGIDLLYHSSPHLLRPLHRVLPYSAVRLYHRPWRNHLKALLRKHR